MLEGGTLRQCRVWGARAVGAMGRQRACPWPRVRKLSGGKNLYAPPNRVNRSSVPIRERKLFPNGNIAAVKAGSGGWRVPVFGRRATKCNPLPQAATAVAVGPRQTELLAWQRNGRSRQMPGRATSWMVGTDGEIGASAADVSGGVWVAHVRPGQRHCRRTRGPRKRRSHGEPRAVPRDSVFIRGPVFTAVAVHPGQTTSAEAPQISCIAATKASFSATVL